MTKRTRSPQCTDSALSSIRAQAATEIRQVTVTFGIDSDVWLDQMLDQLDARKTQ